LAAKPKIARWPTSMVDSPGSYTTRWDVDRENDDAHVSLAP
jgi:hypothetical protein